MLRIFFAFGSDSAVLQYAAKELEQYLSRIHSGADMEISVSFSVKPAEGDGYSVSVEAGQMTLSGSNARAVLLGVYRLLHELGCRFLSPDCESIPSVDLSCYTTLICEQAVYGHRGVCIEGADSLENVLQFIGWLPKLGYNTFFLQHQEPEAFLNDWYQHKYNPLLAPEALTEAEKLHAYSAIDEAIALRGLLHHRVGHGWTSAVIGCKTCVTVGNAPTAQEQSLLAEIGGQRAFWKGVPSNTNLCYANPLAFQAFVGNVVDYAREHPEVDYLHVWLADETNNFCECPQCSATTPTEQYIRILNELDKHLHDLTLSTKIVLLLYQELLWPPIREQLNNPARFTMMFAPIDRTFEKAYDQCGSLPQIPTYFRNHVLPSASLEENLAFLKLWQQKEPTLDSFIYDYHLGRAHYGDLGYLAITKIIARDIYALRQLGLNGCISCQELRVALPNALPNYVMGKMLWNPALDVDEIIVEYYIAAYGTAWHAALAHLEQMSCLSSCDYFNGLGTRYSPALAQRFSLAAQNAAAFAPFAAAQVQGTVATQKKFWQLLDYHCTYCTLIAKALAALANQQQELAQQCWCTFMQFVRQNELCFQSSLDVYRVLEVATKYTGFTLDIPR